MGDFVNNVHLCGKFSNYHNLEFGMRYNDHYRYVSVCAVLDKFKSGDFTDIKDLFESEVAVECEFDHNSYKGEIVNELISWLAICYKLNTQVAFNDFDIYSSGCDNVIKKFGFRKKFFIYA